MLVVDTALGLCTAGVFAVASDGLSKTGVYGNDCAFIGGNGWLT